MILTSTSKIRICKQCDKCIFDVQSKNKSKNDKNKVNKNSMLQCQQCEDYYHAHCLYDIPLEKSDKHLKMFDIFEEYEICYSCY